MVPALRGLLESVGTCGFVGYVEPDTAMSILTCTLEIPRGPAWSHPPTWRATGERYRAAEDPRAVHTQKLRRFVGARTALRRASRATASG